MPTRILPNKKTSLLIPPIYTVEPLAWIGCSGKETAGGRACRLASSSMATHSPSAVITYSVGLNEFAIVSRLLMLMLINVSLPMVAGPGYQPDRYSSPARPFPQCCRYKYCRLHNVSRPLNDDRTRRSARTRTQPSCRPPAHGWCTASSVSALQAIRHSDHVLAVHQ